MIGKTVCGVPPAPHTMSYCIRSSSISTVTGMVCPNGGTPPMAYPVLSRTYSGLAIPGLKPSIRFNFLFLSTLFEPEVITTTAPSGPSKTIDLAM